MRDPTSLPRLVNILEDYLNDPERRPDYEEGLMALRFGVQVAFRCEELGLTPAQIEARSGISPAALLHIQQGILPDALTQTRLARTLQVRIVVEPSGQWRLEAVAQARETLAQAA